MQHLTLWKIKELYYDQMKINFLLLGNHRDVFANQEFQIDNDPRYTVKTEKHSQQVMIWGVFSYMGVVSLYFPEKGATMNPLKYFK